MALYDANGNIKSTVVVGTSPTGLFAADGSVNVVVDDATDKRGIYHPCGAMLVNSDTTKNVYYAPQGRVYKNKALGAKGLA